MASQLSLDKRWAIVNLTIYAGYSQHHIARTLKCSRHTVLRTLQRHKDTGDVVDRKRPGRPPRINIQRTERNPITKAIKRDRQTTSAAIARHIQTTQHITISARRVRQLRRMLGFRSVHYRLAPVLTQEKARKRLQYALEHLDGEWADIIFSDEKLFVITNQGTVVWKRRDEEPIYSHEPKKPEQVMVWGGIYLGGKTKIKIIEGTVDAKAYQQIIDECVVRPHLNDEMRLLQDGAKPHTAHSTLDFLDRKLLRL